MKKFFLFLSGIFFIAFRVGAQCPTNASYASNVLTLNYSSFSGCGTLDHISVTISSGKGAGNTYEIGVSNCNGTTIVTQTNTDIDATSVASTIAYHDASHGTVGTTCNSSTPLPVTLISFYKKDEALLWQTATEINNFGFEIERKLPNSGFETIGFVPSLSTNGNSQSVLSYEFKVKDNFIGEVYYRLKQLDYDGNYEYSNVIFESNSKTKHTMYFDMMGNRLDSPPPPQYGSYLELIFKDGLVQKNIVIR